MLMLIYPKHMYYQKQRYFNTSHVNVNQCTGLKDKNGKHFNTSHVNVNPEPFFIALRIAVFQYISC